MINRSTVKYTLKRILPSALFKVILILWQKIILHVVEKFDAFRLRNFTQEKEVTLTHRGKQFSLVISPENGFIDKHIFLYGVYEPFMLDLISIYLRPGDTFIDIGANIGQHSMYAASITGENGAVHAFEPIPHIYKQLLSSSKSNHFENIVTLHTYALGEHEATETLFVSKNAGGSSLVNTDETKETITVQIKNGDTELAKLAQLNVVKIDVEGYEYEVLLGMQKTIAKHRPTIFIEFSGNIYTSQGKNHGPKILSLLRAHNYSLFDIEDDMKKITNDILFNETISGARKQTNLLCIPQ